MAGTSPGHDVQKNSGQAVVELDRRLDVGEVGDVAENFPAVRGGGGRLRRYTPNGYF